jgi:hypothetical protein
MPDFSGKYARLPTGKQRVQIIENDSYSVVYIFLHRVYRNLTGCRRDIPIMDIERTSERIPKPWRRGEKR